jgi:hypothetical protein
MSRIPRHGGVIPFPIGRRLAGDLNVPAPPFRHNPSAWSQRLPICALAGAAFLIASYLALYQWRIVGSVWDPFFGNGTQRVLDSDLSEQMRGYLRIPDAALGAFGYLTEVILGLVGCTRRWQYRPWVVLLFGIDVIPLGLVSVALVIMQGTVVGAWCTLCLVTALISVILVVMTYDEVWASLTYLNRVWKRTRSTRILWQVFWGRAVPEAEDVALVA